MHRKQNRFFHLSLLLIIIVSAFFLRFYDIENLPSGLFPDEAVNGTDALRANATGQYQLFYPDNQGREGLFINLQALSIKAFGNNLPALKLWSAIFGTLTVLGVFLLSKEIFRSDRAGLISAYLTTFSFWAINFSRIGFRAIMVSFLMSFSFYFLLKGFRTNKYVDFIVAGLIFGLGFHTYIAFRIAPAVVVVLLAFMMITQKHFLKKYWKQILLFFVAVLITLSPMIWEFRRHSEYLGSRSTNISILSEKVNGGHLFRTFFRSFGMSLAKYNFWGDQNWRHNYPPYPILDPIMGIAFLTGFIYATFRAFYLLYLRFKHDVRDEKLYLYFLLLGWFGCMLAPEFMTAEGLPHALRSIGTIPPVMILATIPFLWLLGKKDEYGFSMKLTTVSIISASLIFIAVFNTAKYFIYFRNNPKQHFSFAANVKDLAYQMRTYPDSTEKYVVAENMQRVPIKFLDDGMPNVIFKYPGEIDSIKPEKKFVIFTIDEDLSNKLSNLFPQAEKVLVEKFPGDKFWEIKN